MAANYDIELPIAFDYEYQYSDGSLVSPKAGISKAQATANCEAFCDTISAGGYTPMIYANSSDLKTLIDGASLQQKYMIWARQLYDENILYRRIRYLAIQQYRQDQWIYDKCRL